MKRFWYALFERKRFTLADLIVLAVAVMIVASVALAR